MNFRDAINGRIVLGRTDQSHTAGAPPTGPAGGDLSGTYPNPSVVDDSHNHTAATLPATIVYDGDAAGGDLAGTYPNPSVVDDSHNHTSTTLPATIVYDGDAAGGDLTGTYPNPALAAIIVAGGPTGNATTVPVITWDAKGRLTVVSSATIVGPFPPSGAAGGDLTGTYPNPTVADADLIAIRDLAATAGMLSRTGAGAFAARTLTAPAAGITIANPTGSGGNPTFALANDLASLEAMAGTGLVARTASETYAQRTITGPATGITVSNGDGVAGNPTLALANDLAALEGLGSTGIACRTAADTWAQRIVTGGTGVTITNPGGVAGNIDVALSLGAIDHNLLLNLAVGDVHTQYLLLAGRAGTANDPVLSTTVDGTLTGSSASGADLYLKSTSHATKGALRLNDTQNWWEDIPDQTATGTTLGVAVFDATLAITASGATTVLAPIRIAPVLTMSVTGFNLAGLYGIEFSPTITTGSGADLSALRTGGTITNTAGAGIGSFFMLRANSTLTSATANVAPYGPVTLYNALTLSFTGTGTATLATPFAGVGSAAFIDNVTLLNGGAGTFSANHATVYHRPTVTESAGTLTVTSLRGLWVAAYAPSGSPAVAEQTAVRVDDLAQGTLTLGLSLNSLGRTIEMRHAGPARFGADAQPTNPTKTAVHCDGAFIGRRATFSNAAYTVDNAAGVGDFVVGQTGTMSASRTVTLPAAATAGAGRVVIICDESGSVTGANTIVVSRAGADTINGATTQTISAAYGVLRLVSDGTSKWTLF